MVIIMVLISVSLKHSDTVWTFLDLSSTGSGEVDLDALLEDLCIMEKDMNSSSETDSILSGTIPSPNSPISTKVKVGKCSKISLLYSADILLGACIAEMKSKINNYWSIKVYKHLLKTLLAICNSFIVTPKCIHTVMCVLWYLRWKEFLICNYVVSHPFWILRNTIVLFPVSLIYVHCMMMQLGSSTNWGCSS